MSRAKLLFPAVLFVINPSWGETINELFYTFHKPFKNKVEFRYGNLPLYIGGNFRFSDIL